MLSVSCTCFNGFLSLLDVAWVNKVLYCIVLHCIVDHYIIVNGLNKELGKFFPDI